jgi:hypothetical protein
VGDRRVRTRGRCRERGDRDDPRERGGGLVEHASGRHARAWLDHGVWFGDGDHCVASLRGNRDHVQPDRQPRADPGGLRGGLTRRGGGRLERRPLVERTGRRLPRAALWLLGHRCRDHLRSRVHDDDGSVRLSTLERFYRAGLRRASGGGVRGGLGGLSGLDLGDRVGAVVGSGRRGSRVGKRGLGRRLCGRHVRRRGSRDRLHGRLIDRRARCAVGRGRARGGSRCRRSCWGRV